MGLNFCKKLQNRIFAFLFHEFGRTVSCDIHNYIFTKANFFAKFMKFLRHKNFGLYGNLLKEPKFLTYILHQCGIELAGEDRSKNVL